jgi:hypothetical protein
MWVILEDLKLLGNYTEQRASLVISKEVKNISKHLDSLASVQNGFGDAWNSLYAEVIKIKKGG